MNHFFSPNQISIISYSLGIMIGLALAYGFAWVIVTGWFALCDYIRWRNFK